MAYPFNSSLVFNQNKNDGGQATNTGRVVASEWNSVAQALNEDRTTETSTGRDYTDHKDVSAGMPSTAASGHARLVSNAGQQAVSEDGGPYIWIKSYETYNLGDKRWGIKADWNGSTGTDDTAAINAALAYAVNTSNKRAKVVFPPSWQSRCRSLAIVPPAFGFWLEGAGSLSSQIIVDPSTANGDGITLQSGFAHVWEGFCLMGLVANPGGRMILVDNTVGGFVSGGHRFSDIRLDSPNGTGAYDTGFYFTVGPGNNSEVSYEKVVIWKHKTVGVDLPGNQQLGHNFIACDIQGFWDGVSPTANGGKYGIRANGGPGGAFTFRDGAVGSVRGACFYPNFNALPVVIDNCDTENSYQIIGDGNSGTSLTASGYGVITYKNSRYSVNGDAWMDPNKIISFGGAGVLTVENNQFFNGGTNPTKLLFNFPTFPKGISVKRNVFQTSNSYQTDPIVVQNSTNMRAYVDCRDNLFVGPAAVVDTPYQRNEVLNVVRGDAMISMDAKAETSSELLLVDLTQFNAAAAHQDIEIQTGRPQGITYEEVVGQLYNYIVAGGVAITMRVGVTSGGQELIKDFVVGDSGVGDFGAIYGATASERGTDMPGVCPNFAGTSSIWVRLTAATGNLGNGTTSNITRGIIHLASRSHLQLRFLA